MIKVKTFIFDLRNYVETRINQYVDTFIEDKKAKLIDIKVNILETKLIYTIVYEECK